MNTISHKTDTVNFEVALNNLLAKINEGVKAYWKANGFTYALAPEVRIESIGPKFIRLCKFEERKGVYTCGGVYCFVNRETGGIHKAATFKAADPKNPRACITDADVLKAVTPYGVVYLKGGGTGTISDYLSAV